MLFSQVGIDEPNKFNSFLLFGFVFMWVIGVIYIVSLAVRQRNAQQDIELMQRIMQEDDEDTGPLASE